MEPFMASLWKHPDSKYWTACFAGADGKQKKRSTRSTDKREALRIAHALEEAEEMSAHGYLSTEEQFRLYFTQAYERLFGKKDELETTVRAWLEQWLHNEKGAVSPGTLNRYGQVVKDFLAFLGSKASLRLEGLSTADAIGFRDHLIKEGCSEGNANQVRKILSKPFRQAWQEGRIQRNPIAGVRHLRHSHIEKGTFTPAQIIALLSAAPDPEWRTLILLGYFTGGRLRDLVSLNWSAIDLAESSLVFVQRKTDAKLKIPLHPELQDHLLSLRASDNPKAMLMPKLSRMRGTGKSGLSMAFKRIMAAAGIEAGVARERKGKAGRSISSLSFHSLRHSFVSNLANAGVAPEIRSKLSGHLDDKSHQIYSHHEFETLRASLESVSRLPREAR
jgi:integrase